MKKSQRIKSSVLAVSLGFSSLCSAATDTPTVTGVEQSRMERGEVGHENPAPSGQKWALKKWIEQDKVLPRTVCLLPFARHALMPMHQTTSKKAAKVFIKNTLIMAGMIGLQFAIPAAEKAAVAGDMAGCELETDGTEVSPGRLFLGLEVGMQAGHILAMWLSKLAVDCGVDGGSAGDIEHVSQVTDRP